MKLSSLVRLVSLVCLLGLAALPLRAEEIPAIKARMEQRLASVDGLKDRKVVGETNRGLLEARSTLTPAEEKIVAEENADRSAVYAALSAQTGAPAEQIARRRAQQIANGSKAGVWIQKEDGTWVQK
jgi:uncharacterized protein